MVQGLEELDDEAVQYVYPLGGGLQIGRVYLFYPINLVAITSQIFYIASFT